MKKVLVNIIWIACLASFASSVVYASQLANGTVPPSGGYLAGDSILDPGCAPGTTDCFQNSTTGWGLSGNSGTTAGTNFIGTTDAQNFIVKTNNVQIAKFGQIGNVVLGSSATASGNTSLAGGNLTQATGLGSVAFGFSSLASGSVSTAIGDLVTASGDDSIALGFSTTASGSISTAFGSDTIASGTTSTAFGRGTHAYSTNEIATGSYNTVYTVANTQADRLFVIGNGTGSGSKSDALTILKNGQTSIGIDNFEANSNGNIFQVGNGGTGVIGYVDTATGNWVAVSDAREKHNITDIPYGLDAILKLHPVAFDYNRNNEHTIGFLAQETKQVIPEAVFGSEEKGYGMSYPVLVPALVKSIQELDVKLTTLQSIASLQNQSNWETTVSNWLGDATNGVGTLFAQSFHAKDEICVDGECLTKSDIHNLIQMEHSYQNNSAPTQSVVIPDPVSETPTIASPVVVPATQNESQNSSLQ
jgi:hypothetical protein